MKFEYRAIRQGKDGKTRHVASVPLDNATPQDRLDISAYCMAALNQMHEHGRSPIRIVAVDAETGKPVDLVEKESSDE